MKRLVLWSLLAAFLLIVGVWPAVGDFVGATLGLVFTGAFQLLAQPAVFGLAVVLLFVAHRNRQASTSKKQVA
ncbi:hypothetical protein [Streptomyces sp. cg35]|uniref:hypothetical protein n=1 Tax=Streptomyces sp. cg35 TaxID=3421650 RepID=UPI003D179044